MKQKLLIILTMLAIVAIAVSAIWLGWANTLAIMIIIGGVVLSGWLLWYNFKMLLETWKQLKEVKEVIMELKKKGVEE
jgi:Flp pilus assembly protein TadB